MWPAYALRSIGLLFAVAAVFFLLGGLVQINPIWQWGPYHPCLSENGAQPGWYIGWLIGALRLMPNWEPAIGNCTLIPNPFWGGVFVPLSCSASCSPGRGSSQGHRRPSPPRSPGRSPRPSRPHRGRCRVPQLGGDRVLPILVFFITRSACRTLQRSGAHPWRAWQGEIVRRQPGGRVVVVAKSPDRIEAEPSEPPAGRTVPGHDYNSTSTGE